jgi:RHS repeat-associated protein
MILPVATVLSMESSAATIETGGWIVQKDAFSSRSVAPGQTVDYFIYIQRTGADAGSVSITDTRDPNVTDTYLHPEGIPNRGGYAAPYATWYRTMNQGDGESFWYQVVVKQGLAPGTRIRNRVTVQDGSGTTSLDFDLWVDRPNRTTLAGPAGTAGDPVGTAQGEYVLPPGTDLDLGGPLPLRFSRIYASQLNDPGTDLVRSTLGREWMHNFDVRVIEADPAAGDGSVFVVLETGRVIPFTALEGGGWIRNFPEPAPYELKSDGGDLWFLDPTRDLLFRFASTNSSGVREIVDRNGNALLVERRADGMVTNVSDGLGRALAFVYNAATNLVRVTDGTRSVGFGHDVNGAMTSATNALGGVTLYAYDPTNSFAGGSGALLTAVTYPRGNTPQVQSYATNGQVVAQADAYGHVSTFATSTGGVATVTDPDGSFEHRYDAANDFALSRMYDPSSNYFQFGIDGGRVLSVRDRRGKTSTATFDAATLRLKQTVNRDNRGTWYLRETIAQVFTNRDAPARTVAFDFPDVACVTNANRSTTTFLRDARGNATGIVDRAGAAWATAVNARGQPLTVTTPRGGVRTFAYNPDGTLASVADSDTGATTFAYDAHRRLVRAQHPDGSAEGWAIDALDRVTAHTNTAGGVTTFEYDANGTRTRTVDPAGHETTRLTDLMDRVTNVADSVGTLESTVHDAMGRVVLEIDPAGTNAFVHDPRGWATNLARAGRAWSLGYDAEGNIGTNVSPMGHVRLAFHDNLGRPVSARDPLYGTLHFQDSRWTYDSMGRVVMDKNPMAETNRFGYDAASRLVAHTNPAGAVATFAYDAAGSLVRSTDPEGRSTAFATTPMGRIATVTNAAGEVTGYAYDTAGRPVRIDHPDGARTAFAYDGAGRPARVTDEATNHWHTAYDARGLVVATTNPAGGVSIFTHTSDGNPESESDSDTGPVSNRYDAARRLVETVLPGGATLRYDYNAHHELVAAVDALGRTNRFDYDADGRLTSAADRAGLATTYAYDAAGRLTNLVDRTGAATAFAYDLAGRVVAVTDPTGVRTVFGRDRMGWVTNVTIGTSTWSFARNRTGAITNLVSPGGRSTVRVPDALDRPATIVDALGRTNALARDARGRVTAATDPAGRVTRTDYDPRGLPAAVTLPDSNAVAYAWNALGRLAQMRDLKGAAWQFDYTPMGRLETVTDPLGRATGYAYDPRGDLDTIAWPGGGSVDHTRDANGAIARALFAGGPDLLFARDAEGRITNANDVALRRDAEGRPLGSACAGVEFGATRDDAGRVRTATYSNGAFAVTYTYAVGADGDGRLTRVSDSLTGTQADFGYDEDRRLRTVTLSSGEVITTTWDDAGRLTRLQSGNHVDAALTYDAGGRVDTVDLVAPLSPSGHLAAATAALAYDAASQISTAGYTHDPRGRVTAAPGRTFTWDGASRLTAVGGATLAYTGLGDLLTRTEGAATVRFHHNPALGMAPVVAEQDAATGRMLRYYVWTPGGRLLYLIDAEHGNAVRFFHFDPSGNTLALTDAAGEVTDAWAYDPYGRILARTGTSAQPFTFAGAWGVRQEGADGTLYHMRARHYDAMTGRFLSPEPVWPQIDSPKALNPYQYAAADPVRFSDPSGLSVFNHISIYDSPHRILYRYEDGTTVVVSQQAWWSVDPIHLPGDRLWFPDSMVDGERVQVFVLQDPNDTGEDLGPRRTCHAQPRNTAPVNPPDLGQRYAANWGRSIDSFDQAAPYRPGVSYTVTGGSDSAFGRPTVPLPGTLDAWEAAVADHLARSAASLSRIPRPGGTPVTLVPRPNDIGGQMLKVGAEIAAEKAAKLAAQKAIEKALQKKLGQEVAAKVAAAAMQKLNVALLLAEGGMAVNQLVGWANMSPEEFAAAAQQETSYQLVDAMVQQGGIMGDAVNAVGSLVSWLLGD